MGGYHGIMALNPKQQLFVQEYLVDMNATQAAIRAGYSEATAHSQGPRLLEHAEVRKEIEKGQAERAARIQINAQWVLEKAVEVHTLAKESGNLSAANKSLELIGKHIGVQAFKELIEHSGTLNIAERIANARKRAKGGDDA